MRASPIRDSCTFVCEFIVAIWGVPCAGRGLGGLESVLGPRGECPPGEHSMERPRGAAPMPVTLFATTSKLHKKLAGEYESQRLERAADIVQRNREELAEALAGLRRHRKPSGSTIFTKPQARIGSASTGKGTDARPVPIKLQPCPAGNEADKVLVPARGGGQSTTSARTWAIPSPAPLAPYKGWTHTRSNVMAVARPRRMFYTGAP